ncbi:DUF6438 domain-containing protein [Psychroserpens ponticola]|uniref:DUF6438 domain-containing protein n=1 Tax=Psychroserpens ponticola TaxID=2932268 RepID=A0ABY7S3R3_9FLAO|nr:DUF6438 domain-containing protein [Psychroserpens ponticola]WCO03617.1 DUF6438 domain-containing protein [Psychroserpens ponticola]
MKAEIISSRIDSLNSQDEVQAFVNKLNYPFFERKISEDSVRIYRKFEEFELKKINEFNRDCRFDVDSLTKKVADSLKINKSFYKSDFDNNGFTDLLIIGDRHNCMAMADCDGYISCDFSVYSLMNYGNDSINSIDLNFITMSESLVPKILNDENGSRIELHRPISYKIVHGEKVTIKKITSVVHKFESFIEYNDNIKSYDIENVEFTAHGCGAGCPEFNLSINKNRRGKLDATNYNWIDKNYSYNLEPSDINGKYESIISEKHVSEIFDIINYLDFTKLDEEYSSGAMHSSYCTLRVTYDNGKTKIIKDDGMIGSFGLKRVYEMLYELRFNQEWK